METSKIEVGDICVVEDIEYIHTAYFEFSNEAGHPDIQEKKYLKGSNYSIVDAKEVRVLFVKKITTRANNIVAIVETTNNSEYLKFIINIKGLTLSQKKSEEEDFKGFIAEYLSGKPITGMIPHKYVNKLLMKTIIQKNPMDIQFVKHNLITTEFYKQVLVKDGGLLGLIPEERRTLELCRLAVSEEPYAETFVPERFKSLVNS